MGNGTSVNATRMKSGLRAFAYTEVLDVSEDLIIKSKVVARNDIDTCILLDLPVGETEALGLGQEIGLGKFATPVLTHKSAAASQNTISREARIRTSLSRLLQVTVYTHAGKPENGGLNHLDGGPEYLLFVKRFSVQQIESQPDTNGQDHKDRGGSAYERNTLPLPIL